MYNSLLAFGGVSNLTIGMTMWRLESRAETFASGLQISGARYEFTCLRARGSLNLEN